MEEKKEKPTPPISLRLTKEERIQLTAAAGERGMSAYIRSRLFGARTKPRIVRVPSSDARHFAHILALLGQSGISESLRELADAARNGTLPVAPETEALVYAACAAVEKMRADLFRALQLRDGVEE